MTMVLFTRALAFANPFVPRTSRFGESLWFDGEVRLGWGVEVRSGERPLVGLFPFVRTCFGAEPFFLPRAPI